MYNTVIFDLDGTLLDTLDDLMDSVNYVLNIYKFPLRNKMEIRSFVGNGIYNLLKLSMPSDVSEERFLEAFNMFKSYYTKHCKVKTKPYDGIIELLDYLKLNNYKVAIVSNKNDAAVKELANYHFKDHIDVAIGEREGINKKPSPDTVNEAVKILGCRKHNAIYVGDSEVDKETADNAKMNCVLVDWGFRDRENLLKLNADKIISAPSELLSVLKSKKVINI